MQTTHLINHSLELRLALSLVAAISLFAIVMLHLQILQEERYLTEAFGAPYRAYCRRVFRYLGRR